MRIDDVTVHFMKATAIPLSHRVRVIGRLRTGPGWAIQHRPIAQLFLYLIRLMPGKFRLARSWCRRMLWVLFRGNARHSKLSTQDIMTINLLLNRLGEVADSDRLTAAALDRLTHHCRVLEGNAQSYRFKD